MHRCLRMTKKASFMLSEYADPSLLHVVCVGASGSKKKRKIASHELFAQALCHMRDPDDDDEQEAASREDLFDSPNLTQHQRDMLPLLDMIREEREAQKKADDEHKQSQAQHLQDKKEREQLEAARQAKEDLQIQELLDKQSREGSNLPGMIAGALGQVLAPYFQGLQDALKKAHDN